ncbi:MAG: acyl-CoA mutase large subunit family protein [Candidatus Kapabacteria bacterium]|nr:acyl-CoA mutase large subunit family protein [Ignavibacteriota bacterium]MCW5884071.1 acyl-CoA mutase large subunit family protein [Candidatus Kapabacteria bacterium]
MSEENKRFFEEFDFPNYDDWKNAAVSALKGVPFEKVMFTPTYEGITLKPIYNKEDIENIPHISQDFPGFNPYSRGGSVSGYKLNDFEISQNIPYPITNDFNEALKNDLSRGQNSIRINLDKAAAMHEDFTDDDLSGINLCISNLDDLKSALKDIELSKFPVNIDAGIAALPAFVSLISAAINSKELKGTLNFDFITEFTKEGNLPDNFDKFISEMSAVTKYANVNMPDFRTIAISGYEWHNAGANAVQELAVSISLGVFYIRQLLEKGLTIDEISPKISFSLAIGINFFMEISKFRAFRIIWSKIIKEFGGNEESQKVHIHAVTSEREHTKLDPYVNMLRATSQVFSAITGNCDSITVNHFDKEFGLPNGFSRRTARNTQNVIKYESHLDDTIDPAAGSYYIESLTEQLIKSAWNEFITIENNGGIISEIKSSSIQNKIEANFNKRLENIAFRKDIIVGVNKYANIHEKPVETTLDFDRNKLTEYVKSFDSYIQNRNTENIDNLLDEFEEKFNNDEIQSISIAADALKAGATLAELYNSIPFDAPEFNEVTPIYLRRSSEVLEEMREVISDYIALNGKNPQLDFVCFGALRDWKARADFSNDFFSVGGFSNKIYDGLSSADEAISKIDFSLKRIIVVCSTDDKYAEFLTEFAQKVKSANSENFVILAGYPKDMIDTYKAAGVDMFIHVKANIIECLREIYEVSGLTK